MSKNVTQADIDAVASALRGEFATQVGALTESVQGLTGLIERATAQFATPAPVVTAITDAPSVKRTRKAPAKTTAKAKGAKATTAKAEPVVLTLDDAQAKVDAGENAWKLMVLSTKGNPIPFGMVLRAQGVKNGTVATRTRTREENAELAAFLKDNALPCNGPVWEKAKTTRSLRTLKALAKKVAATA